MEHATHERVMDLVADAMDRATSDREALLEHACADDSNLRRRVCDLLDVAAPAGRAFDRGARDVALAALRAAMPARVGSYRLIAPIGQGGMGAVYLAEQQRTQRRVAIKLMRPGAVTAEGLARFEYEAELLGRLEHPGIARIYEAGVAPVEGLGGADGQPFFAMEHVEGLRLDEFLARADRPLRARIELLVRICRAVHYAHTRGVIHRDLKPANILVADDGGPKVLDFGVARVTEPRGPGAATSHTASGQLVGTLAYMSPEQACGRTRDIDPASDVYALGVIAHEMLSGGRAPYETANLPVHEAVRAICEQAPPRLGALNRALRGDVETIVGKAMEKERSRRYATAAEFADDLERHLGHEPIAARPPSAAYQLGKFARRNKVLVASLAVVMVVLIAGTCVSTLAMLRAERQRELAERRGRDHAAVAQFVRDMLAAADPYHLLGENVTVLEATRAAATRLDAGQLDDQPLVKAGVLDTIGNTLAALGRYDEAEPALRQSLSIRRAALPARHADLATSLGNLAVLLRKRGNLAEAEGFARESLRINRDVHNARPHPDLATSMSNLALVLHDQGKLPEAETLLREAWDVFRRALPGDHPAIASCLNDLAALLQDRGSLADAEALYREALARRRRALPGGHPDTANSLNNLATVLWAQGKLPEAEKLFRAALDAHRAALPAGHVTIARDTSNLATVLMAQGKLDEAEPLYRDALRMLRAALPPGHSDVAGALNNLATLLRDRGQADDAEALFREALDVWRRALPANHPHVATSLSNVALLLHNRGDYEGAEQMYREALAIVRAALPGDHPELTKSLSNLGLVLRKRGELGESERLLREALELTRAAHSAGHADLAAALSNLATVLKDRGQLDEAEPLYRESLRICDSNPEQTRAVTARIATHLHDLLARANRADEAEALRHQYALAPR